MVGRGEVDGDLATETIQECSRYGDVENCVVFQNPIENCPEDEAVIIYVKFQFEVDCEKGESLLVHVARSCSGRKVE